MKSSGDFSDLLHDYSFFLPHELIAQAPSPQREDARLLIVRRAPEKGLPRFEDLKVSDLPDFARDNPEILRTPWLRNRSKVFPARFYARRPTGGRHEIVLLYSLNASQTRWQAIIRGVADFRYPQKLKAEALSEVDAIEFSCTEAGVVDFSENGIKVLEWIWKVGQMPLPPYIKERNRERDLERYQSVWAEERHTGSAAAPTASLHFSHELEEKVRSLGVSFVDVALHVGLGTFEPVRCEKLSEHTLHSENFLVDSKNRKILEQQKDFFCVGTTALRCLESLPFQNHAALKDCQIQDLPEGGALGWKGSTKIFVRPGFEFKRTRFLWTNFHLPESTLFVLVSCFAGSRMLALEAYQHAIQKGYHFFSYGDASLWI